MIVGSSTLLTLTGQLTWPLLLSFITVGILPNQVNAATWSVFGRLINSSHWPLLLSTDTSSDRKVFKRVQGVTWLSSVVGFLLAVAAAITPLGVHIRIRLFRQDDVPFTYVKDISSIGQAALNRSLYHTNRLCGGWVPRICPGQPHTFNDTLDHPYIWGDIAANITDVFDSVHGAGKSASTLSSFLDIQYRAFVDWTNETVPYLHDSVIWTDGGRNKAHTQGRFQYYQPFILNSRIEPVEGLIVSTTDTPGIGFRNHTLPPASEYGYVWAEDILWLELETVCTDLNITLEYTIPKWGMLESAERPHLVDRGGLVNNPIYAPNLDLNASQFNPKLLEKSWIGAVLTNAILKGVLNEFQDDLHLDKVYHLDDITGCTDTSLSSLTPGQLSFGSYGAADRHADIWSPHLPGVLAKCTSWSMNENMGLNVTYAGMCIRASRCAIEL